MIRSAVIFFSIAFVFMFFFFLGKNQKLSEDIENYKKVLSQKEEQITELEKYNSEMPSVYYKECNNIIYGLWYDCQRKSGCEYIREKIDL